MGNKNKTIALAVSGGKDSMGMVYALKDALKDCYNIVSLTVDHRLRKESLQEAYQIKQWMEALNIPHVILTWDHEVISTDIQNKARIARYDLMTEWCLENNVRTLMTAHHLEDQIETFFMRLAKGSGLKGLCGMRSCIDYKGVQIVRPFLSISKKKLHAYIKEGQWIEDPSNQNMNFTRVKFRSLVEDYLKLDPSAQIIKTIEKLKEADDYLDEIAKETLDRDGLSMQPYVIFERMINKMFSKNGYPFKSKKIRHLHETLHRANFKATTFAHYVFHKKNNQQSNKIELKPEKR